MSQKMVKCKVSTWGVAPAPQYSHGIMTCSRMEKTAHAEIPAGGAGQGRGWSLELYRYRGTSPINHYLMTGVTLF